MLNKLHATRGGLPDDRPIDVRAPDSIALGAPAEPAD